MPNWCSNRVTFCGEPNDIKQIVRLLETEKSVFDFNAVIPKPEVFDEIVSGHCKIDGKEYRVWRVVDGKNVPVSDEEIAQLKRSYGSTNWYDWCRTNWGTKWNASEPQRTDLDEYTVEYIFDTAWGPPEQVCNKLREMFPKVNISWFYDEPGCELAGYL